MATVSGSLLFVSSRAAQVSEVWLHAREVRTHDRGVVTTGNDRFPVQDGEVTFTALPGPAVLALISQGRAVDTIPIVVGESDEQSLRNVVRAAQLVDDSTQREIERLSVEMMEALDSAREEAKAAEGHARTAEGHATKAEGQVSVARGQAEAAASSAEEAKGHASTAEGHASRAQSSAEESGRAADRAEGARSEARTAWDGAKEARDAAQNHASTAEGHASTAQGHASNASAQATKSENAANRLWDSVSWSDDRLSVAGRQSDPLTGPRGPRGPAGSLEGLNPETIVRTGDQDTRLGKYLTVDATGQGNASASLFLKKDEHQFEFFTNAAGKFGAWDKRYSRGLFQADRNSFEHQTAVDMGNNQLRGLPAPSGDNHAATKSYVDSAVDGVQVDTSGLAPKEHTHEAQDIKGVQGPATSQPTSNSLVVRDANGRAAFRPPVNGYDAVNKNYADSLVDPVRNRVGKLESRIQLVDSLPSRPNSGTLYLIGE